MSKKIISIITVLALMLTMMVPIMGAGGDGIGDDNFPSSVTIHNTYLLGEYTLGTEKIFKISTYASGNEGAIVRRDVKVTNGEQVLPLEFLDGDTWKDISEYNTQISLKNEVEKQIRVIFETAGVYTITFTLSDANGNQLKQSKRVVMVSNDGISLYTEPETTTEIVTTESETTTEEITTIPETTTIEVETTTPVETIIIVDPKPETTTAPEKVTAPKRAVIKKVEAKKASSKKVKISLKKIKEADGYQVAIYKTKKNAKQNKKAVVKKFVKEIKITITSKKLKNKKDLFVKARAYVLKNKKTKVYGKWSNVKKIKVKK